MACSDFSAKRGTKRQLTIDMSSSALPKLPVSSSLVAVVPQAIIRSPRLQPGKIVFSDPKRDLQHYRGMNGLGSDAARSPKMTHLRHQLNDEQTDNGHNFLRPRGRSVKPVEEKRT